MRLIDVEKANVETISCSYSDHTTLEDVQEWLDAQPTLTPESLVKRGRWKLNNDGSGTCDQCHFTQLHVWDFDHVQRYCGVCGALMED